MNEPPIVESFYPIRPTEKGMIGFAAVLYGGLSLQSIAVYSTNNGGIRLLFPDKTLPNGRVVTSFFPIDKATYDLLRDAVARKVETVAEKVKGDYSYGNRRSEPLQTEFHERLEYPRSK